MLWLTNQNWEFQTDVFDFGVQYDWDMFLTGFVRFTNKSKAITWSFVTLLHTLDAFHFFLLDRWASDHLGGLKYKTVLWWYRYESVRQAHLKCLCEKEKGGERERVRVTESKREGKVCGSAEPDTNEPPFWWDLTAQKKAESLDTDATQHSLLIGAVCMCARCVQGNLCRNKIRFVWNMLITMIIHSWVWLGPRLICRRTSLRLRFTLFTTPKLSFFLSLSLIHTFSALFACIWGNCCGRAVDLNYCASATVINLMH